MTRGPVEAHHQHGKIIGGSGAESYLKLNLGLCDVLLTSASTGDFLSFRDLGLDSLFAKVLNGEAFDCVDAQIRVGLNDGKTSRDCRIISVFQLFPMLSKEY